MWAAARRLHDETKAAKMRLCKLEAAAIEALQLKLYSRAADAFEAVATEVVGEDNFDGCERDADSSSSRRFVQLGRAASTT